MKRKPGRPSKYDFSSVDWSMRTSDIARVLGCTKALVSAMRAMLAPETMMNSPERVAKRYEGVDWSRSFTAIAADLGVSVASVSVAARKLVPHVRKRRGRPKGQHREWVEDWSRSDKEIAESRGLSRQGVNWQRRRHEKAWREKLIFT